MARGRLGSVSSIFAGLPGSPGEPSKSGGPGSTPPAAGAAGSGGVRGEVKGVGGDGGEAGAGGGGRSERPAPLTVSQLGQRIEGVIKSGLGESIRVTGEVSNFNIRNHWYFKVKDADAVMDVVVWASRAGSIGFVPTQGQQVVLSGRVEYYAPRGTIAMYAQTVEPAGTGSLDEQLRKLAAELRALGWMDPERKRKLPVLARNIAVITSRTGAALADVIATAKRRCPAVGIILVDTLVQGPSAAPGVAAALNWVSQHAAKYQIDAVLLTRGGGSLEDLWAFNDRAVAGAIIACSVPVVAAIGHETDTTIAELVADERASTPTQAAMRLTPDRAALLEQAAVTLARLNHSMARVLSGANRETVHATSRLTSALRLHLRQEHGRLLKMAAAVDRARPSKQLAERRAGIESLALRLERAVALVRKSERQRVVSGLERLAVVMRRSVDAARRRLESSSRQLELVGPRAVLLRGFSITLGADGRPLVNASQVTGAEVVRTILAEGQFRSRVIDPDAVRPAEDPQIGAREGTLAAGSSESAADEAARALIERVAKSGRARTRRAGRDLPGQAGLFGPGGEPGQGS